MASNQKFDRLLKEGRALRFLAEKKMATADEIGQAVLRDPSLPSHVIFAVGAEYGSRLVSAGRARREGKRFSVMR